MRAMISLAESRCPFAEGFIQVTLRRVSSPPPLPIPALSFSYFITPVKEAFDRRWQRPSTVTQLEGELWSIHSSWQTRSKKQLHKDKQRRKRNQDQKIIGGGGGGNELGIQINCFSSLAHSFHTIDIVATYLKTDYKKDEVNTVS